MRLASQDITNVMHPGYDKVTKTEINRAFKELVSEFENEEGEVPNWLFTVWYDISQKLHLPADPRCQQEIDRPIGLRKE